MLRIQLAENRTSNIIDVGIQASLADVTVVTATQRLKHLIDDGFNLHMRDKGLKTWPTPETYTWDIWLRKLWRDMEDVSPQSLNSLISNRQSQQIWERVIAGVIKQDYSEGYEYLLWHITATSNRVREAYNLLKAYKIDTSDFSDLLSEDSTHFLRWYREYQKVLSKNGWIDGEMLPDQIQACASEEFLTAGTSLMFAGFEDLTPQQRDLIDYLIKYGWQVNYAQPPDRPRCSQIRQFEFESTDQEIDICARWARAVVEADPERHHVGVVVYNLSELYSRVNRVFSKYLNPNAVLTNRQSNNLSYHITVGPPLEAAPIVVDALNLLQLIRPEVEISILCSIIRSDRIRHWDQELAARSQIATDICGIGSSTASIDDVLKLVRQSRRRVYQCPVLIGILNSAIELRDAIPERATYAYWGEFFLKWLKTFQSETKSNRDFGVDESKSYQTFVSVVESLSELGYVSQPVSVENALAKLARCIGDFKVQPRAVRTPIQVGEDIALSGQSYTHLWMLGMSNEVVPALGHPNPFIPLTVQKKYNIPNALPEILQLRAHNRIERLLQSTHYAVQSYALSDGSTYALPCSLLRDCVRFEMTELPLRLDYEDYIARVSHENKKIQKLSDWHACSVGDEELGSVRGGTSLVRSQSQCSFRGFGEFRLHLQAGESVQVGVTALERGSLVHDTLQLLYEKYIRADQLRTAIANGEFLRDAKNFSQVTIRELNSQRVRPLSEDLIDIEIGIVCSLIEKWMEFEPLLSGGEVFGSEKSIEYQLAGLNLRMRIDRVDKISKDRDLRIIDFKTGSCKLADLMEERPREPQLLLYSCALIEQGHEVTDIAYVRLKTSDFGYLAWSDIDSWPRHLRKEHAPITGTTTAQWKRLLEDIVQNFLSGKANLDPLIKACDYCEIAPVCRIVEHNQLKGIEANENE